MQVVAARVAGVRPAKSSRTASVSQGAAGAQRLQGDGAQLAHRRGGGGPVPDDVADGEGDAVAGQGNDVEPVAAGNEVATGDPVVGGDLHPGQDGQDLGQQAALKFQDQAGGLPVALLGGGGGGLGGASGGHHIRGVDRLHDDAADRPVGVAPGGYVEGVERLLQLSVTVPIGEDPLFVALGADAAQGLVEEFEDVLAGEFRHGLLERLPDQVAAIADSGAHLRVRGHHSQVGTLEDPYEPG